MNQDLPENQLTQKHLEKIKTFYGKNNLTTNTFGIGYRKLIARSLGYIIPENASVLEIGCGHGALLKLLKNKDVTGIDVAPEQVEAAQKNVAHGKFFCMSGEEISLDRKFDFIILSDTLNEAADVQALLEKIQSVATPSTRLVINFYNTLWRPALSLLTMFGFKAKRPESSWLSCTDVRGLLGLANWDVIREEPRILFPLQIPVLQTLLNRYMAPFFSFCNLTCFTVARPMGVANEDQPSVTVVVPARNESGNIEDAVKRTPKMGKWTELLFIEGNSTDNTWEEIQRVKAAYPDHKITIMQQSGKGKGNAVRDAFEAAQGDILMILDADLTMPPEDLPKYYHAITSGKAEFVNGVRLVYPMEDKAMRFLNMCGNKFFSIVFSWLLSQPVKDTLCGTKVIYKTDYQKIAANRSYFGNFDPFGDFDLLFGASKLNLKIVDIPIRYRNRNYGDTNISRFRHGMILLRMVAYASRKLKFI